MSSTKLPKLPRVAASDNPWGVALVDLRPITLGMMSATSDPKVAQTFAELCGSDGLEFVDAARSVARTGTLPVALSVEGPVADGILFSPTEMEDKWALFLHQGMLIGVRSWSADIGFVADVVHEDGALVARSYGGALFQGEAPERGARLLEWLVRTLGLREALPLPLSTTTPPKGSSLGIVCMSEWGRAAQLATHEPIVYPRSARPLRTISLLHIAAARGDIEAGADPMEGRRGCVSHPALRPAPAPQGEPLSSCQVGRWSARRCREFA